MQLTLLAYDYVEDIVTLREPHRPGHLALVQRMHEDGRLLLAGATGDPPSGALFVFTDRDAAAAFRDEDPYGDAGLLTGSRIQPWNVVAGDPYPGGGGGGGEEE